MKLISINEVNNYAKSMNEESYKSFMKNHKNYKLMWHDQGIKFWIQLIIKLKYHLLQGSSKYDVYCENEIISFLKAITSQKFSDIVQFIENSYKLSKDRNILKLSLSLETQNLMGCMQQSELKRDVQLRVISVNLRCSGTFINIYNLWRNAHSSENCAYTPPENWLLPVFETDALESYIRSRFSKRADINEILGIDINKLQWWTTPSKKIENIVDKTPKNMIIPWIPKFNDNFIFPVPPAPITKETIMLALVKQVFENSFGPLLSERFHSINAELLNQNQYDTHKKFMSINSWYIMQSETLGIKFLRDVVDKTTEDPTPDWPNEIAFDIKILKSYHDRIGGPNIITDSVQNISEYLLNKCIIMQLPWEPFLFRHWISAAFIQLAKFEFDTMHFRHWPLDKNNKLIKIIKKLIHVSSNIKSRLIFGWILISSDVTHNKNLRDTLLPNHIYSRVILPTFKFFEFITSNECVKIIDSLRKSFWKNNTNLNDQVNVSSELYVISDFISYYYTNFFGNYFIWEKGFNRYDYFPTWYVKSGREEHDFNLFISKVLTDIESYDETKLNEINNNKYKLNEFQTHELELFYCIAGIRKNLNLYSKDDCLLKSKILLRKVFDKCNHFSDDNIKKVLLLLDSDDAKEFANNLFNLSKSLDISKPIEQIIVSTIMYHFTETLIRVNFINKLNNNVMNVLIMSSAYVMAHEQLIRIISSISLLVNETPNVCNNNNCPVNCYVNLKQSDDILNIDTLVENINKHLTDEELYKMYPSEWQTPVVIDDVPDGSIDVKIIVKSLENRIGKILFNTFFKDNFNLFNKQGSYRDSRILQYLIPGYLTLLYDLNDLPQDEHNIKRKDNMILFLNGVVKNYEETYLDWKNNGTINRYHRMCDERDEKVRAAAVVCNYYIERTTAILHGFTGTGRSIEQADRLPQLKSTLLILSQCAMFYCAEQTSKIEFFASEDWYNIVYRHFEVLNKICTNDLPVPSPNTLLRCHELQNLYFSHEVIHVMEAILTYQLWFGLSKIGRGTNDHIVFQNMVKPLRLWRYELFTVLFETENFNFSEEMLNTFVNGRGKSILLKLFKACINARHYIETDVAYKKFTRLFSNVGPVMKELHELPIPKGKVGIEVKKFLKNELKVLELFKSKETKEKDEYLNYQNPLKKCFNCKRMETSPGTFKISCDKCEEQNFPIRNIYCSIRCKDEFWRVEHNIQHMEFELGIFDFAG